MFTFFSSYQIHQETLHLLSHTQIYFSTFQKHCENYKYIFCCPFQGSLNCFYMPKHDKLIHPFMQQRIFLYTAYGGINSRLCLYVLKQNENLGTRTFDKSHSILLTQNKAD